MSSSTEILVKGDRFIKRVYHEVDISGVDSMVEAIFASSSRKHHGLFDVKMPLASSFEENSKNHMTQCPCTVELTQRSAIVAVRLPYIPLMGGFQIIPATDYLQEHYRYAGYVTEGHALLRIAVKPEAHNSYYFIVVLPTEVSGRITTTTPNCYLVSKFAGPIFRKPLFPNIFEDSRMCMGSTFTIEANNNTIQHATQACIDSLLETQWNSDLLTETTRDFLSFKKVADPLLNVDVWVRLSRVMPNCASTVSNSYLSVLT